jgi:hypothetical protein
MFGILDVGMTKTAQAAGIHSDYLLVWSSDMSIDDGKQDPDFLAVIDVRKGSPTYGTVINTASVPCIPNANLLDELSIKPGISSCFSNEAHHITMKFYVDPVNQHKYLFAAGLVSGNIFKFDVTDPLHIPQATLVVTAQDVKKFSVPDDILFLPNGNLVATYMGAKNLTTPGGLVEFSLNGEIIGEYDATMRQGPQRYTPNIKGIRNTGLLAHPHGISLREDLNILVTSDFADPLSLAKSGTNQLQDFGTTVRIWNLSNLVDGPQKIVQVPDGPRVEANRNHEEPEGLMSVSLLNHKNHKGSFTASMCGGTLYYAPNITAENPTFRQVYDSGPCTGQSVFRITEDDKFLILPIAGNQSPGDPVYERDYLGEHSRRIVVLDIRPLINRGTKPLLCGPPSVVKNPATGYTTGIYGHNNSAPDCPVEVANFQVNSGVNFFTRGGPHFVQLDGDETRFAFVNYFLDLKDLGFSGSGMGGDLKIFMANFDKTNGASAIDTLFKDELTGGVGINFDRPTTYKWPGNRGYAGAAKPHAVIFVN